MLVSSFCASRPRDATRRMSRERAALRSSVAAATPRRFSPRGAASSTSRRDAAAPRGGRRAAAAAQHQLRRSSISSVAAAGQQQQATAVSRDDERSTVAFLLKPMRASTLCATVKGFVAMALSMIGLGMSSPTFLSAAGYASSPSAPAPIGR